MKRKKVLIGLIVAAFLGGGQFVSAQPKANYQNNLIEIGPDNIGGRVRSIIVDEANPAHTTLYAGGVAGGLYRKDGNDTWKYIPYIVNNQEITLPISYMIQLPDNSLLIATGEGFVEEHGTLIERMAPKGRGVYHFNPSDNSFTLLAATNPKTDSRWTYVNKLAAFERDGNLYVYAATTEGLFRWAFNAANPDWSAAPSLAMAGNFQDVIFITADNVAYASCPGRLVRVGNVTAQSTPVDVTHSNSAFANSSRIVLAANTEHAYDSTSASYTHTTYLYAMVANNHGLLDAVYLTTDQQTWSRLTTATITPFTSNKNPGYRDAAIAINPKNYKEIVIGGASLWRGQGFVPNSYYQWEKISYSEEELNTSNYMSQAYSSVMFMHSGIHQIVYTFEKNAAGDSIWKIYCATDGGVFKMNPVSDSIQNINKGFNTVQFNDIAISPDGSIIGGAVDNSCPFIQSRNAHNGGVPTNDWYDDDPNSNMNHIGSVLWMGNGGGVAASMFQQLLPLSRRCIFVSSEPGRFNFSSGMGVGNAASFGRAYADYANYSQTQTWTAGSAFTSDVIPNSSPIPRVYLWETTNNTKLKDSVTFTLDTLGVYFHNGQETPLHGDTQIEPGDAVLVPSPSHFDYPFRYTFNTAFTAKNKMTHTVSNPLASRLLVSARDNSGTGAVFMNFTPSDFRKVWDPNEAGSTDASTIAKLMHWGLVYKADAGFSVGAVALNRTGDAAYIAVTNDSTGNSFIFRVYRLDSADANNPARAKVEVGFCRDWDGMPRVTLFDTIWAADGDWFKRPISNIIVDPRANTSEFLITFSGYDTLGMPNMVLVQNADDTNTRTVTNVNVINTAVGMTAADPVYTALFECTTGKVYVGTEKGVFVANNAIPGANWESYGAFNGVPVTAIKQQTSNLPRVRFDMHSGINTESYLFAKTKYPYAIYFGTYGRGIFMDSTYVTDHVNEVADSSDFAGITNVDKGDNKISVYPNPAADHATIDIAVAQAGKAMLKIYDINGKLVKVADLGYLTEGLHSYTIDCNGLYRGMYLVNLNFGQQTATSKLIVR